VFEFFATHGIEYEVYDHPEAPTIEIAREYWHQDGSKHCKNLFFRNHKGNRHYLVVFDCEQSLAIHDLEHRLHQGKLSFASEQRMERYLGLRPGSVSPFGLINDMNLVRETPEGMQPCEGVAAKELFENGHRVKLFLDADLQSAERISFHPCDNTASTVVSNEGFRRFLELWGGEYEWITVGEDL
jgi:Ala-tRNA(Pro) deacylase